MEIKESGVLENWSDGMMGEAEKHAGRPAGRHGRAMAGFTLIEFLVAIAMAMVIMAALFRTFKVQQDSYVIQDQVSAMQQNLRAAMYLITRDLQMAGFYTNFDGTNITMDWNADGADETGRPLIFARNDITATGDGIRDGTDEIVIVKASREEGRFLEDGEGASGISLSLSDWNLGGSPEDDLKVSRNDANGTTGKMYGILVKNDLSRAELFQLSGSNLTRSLAESYTGQPDDGNPSTPNLSDRIHRADIIIYRIDDSTPARPCLVRRNLGSDNGFQVIAEHIENLQFRYLLSNGAWTTNLTGNQNFVRAVEVFLVARTANPQRGYRDTSTYTFGSGTTAYTFTPAGDDRNYRRRVLTALVKTRNIGL